MDALISHRLMSYRVARLIREGQKITDTHRNGPALLGSFIGHAQTSAETVTCAGVGDGNCEESQPKDPPDSGGAGISGCDISHAISAYQQSEAC